MINLNDMTQYILNELDNFLLHLQSNNYSQETIYNYERDLKTFEYFLSNEIKKDFKNVDKKDIEKYKAYLSSVDRKTSQGKIPEKKLESYSINRILSSLRRYLKFLIKTGYEYSISPEHIDLIRTEKKHIRIAPLKDIIKLIESPTFFEKNEIIAIRNRAILEVLFSTGMRISEITNLRKEQIDNEGKIFIIGKGKKERFVYLTKRAIKYIEEYQKINPEKESVYLFIPYRGKNNLKKNKKISTNYLQEKIKKYREFLGINIPISAHNIRHAFATYLAEKGANPAAIQILLGHESLDTTTKYVNPSDKYAQETHKKYHPLK